MEYLLYTFDDMVGFEGFAVILEDLAVDRKARLGAQMSGQLTGVVVLHHQGAPAGLQDSPHFGLMERHQVPDLEVISRNTLCGQERHGLTDDPLCGAPANQRHLSVCRAKKLRRRAVFEQSLHFTHALLHHAYSDFWIGEL